jgi:hypothetical protein
MRRPSPSIVISLIALVFAMSGTAYAATGGTFILGRANTANSVSSLSNRHGTALSLSSAKGKPPLSVSSSVQVPKLNASQLGGIPAGGFITGIGHASSGQESLTGTGSISVALTTGSALIGQCDSGGTGADLFLSLGTGASASWWNYNGVSNSDSSAQITQLSKSDFVVLAQVADVTADGTAISTYIGSQTYNSGTDTCSFTAQVLTTGS